MAARSSARHRLICSSPQLSIVGSSRLQFDDALAAWPRSSTTLRSDRHRAYVDARTVPPELRQRIQTTILCLFHSLLNGIQQWMAVIWRITTTLSGEDLSPRLD